jgi:hypothetical protein
VNNPQPEISLKGFKIPVAMQEIVPLFNAEGSNYAIERPSNGISRRTQASVVFRGCHRKIDAAAIENLKLQQSSLHLKEHSVPTDAL